MEEEKESEEDEYSNVKSTHCLDCCGSDTSWRSPWHDTYAPAREKK